MTYQPRLRLHNPKQNRVCRVFGKSSADPTKGRRNRLQNACL